MRFPLLLLSLLFLSSFQLSAQTSTMRGSTSINDVIVFDKYEYDFGSVPEGTVIDRTFTLTNKSNADLYILDVETSCGCTVPDYTLEAIAAGQSDKIQVKFDTNTKVGMQVKTITVKTSAGTKTLKLKGMVYPKDRNY